MFHVLCALWPSYLLVSLNVNSFILNNIIPSYRAPVAPPGEFNAHITSAVLRLECSIDCISGSVGHQQNVFR